MRARDAGSAPRGAGQALGVRSGFHPDAPRALKQLFKPNSPSFLKPAPRRIPTSRSGRAQSVSIGGSGSRRAVTGCLCISRPKGLYRRLCLRSYSRRPSRCSSLSSPVSLLPPAVAVSARPSARPRPRPCSSLLALADTDLTRPLRQRGAGSRARWPPPTVPGPSPGAAPGPSCYPELMARQSPRPSSLPLPPGWSADAVSRPSGRALPLPCAPCPSPHTSTPALPGGEGPGAGSRRVSSHPVLSAGPLLTANTLPRAPLSEAVLPPPRVEPTVLCSPTPAPSGHSPMAAVPRGGKPSVSRISGSHLWSWPVPTSLALLVASK